MKNQIRSAAINDAAGIAALIRDIGWFPAINQFSFEEAPKKIEVDLHKILYTFSNHLSKFRFSIHCSRV